MRCNLWCWHGRRSTYASRKVSVTGLACLLVLLCGCLLNTGCGTPEPERDAETVVEAETDTTGQDGSSTTESDSSSTVDTTNWSTPVGKLFADLARAVAPMHVYGLCDLPAGAALSDVWWPVADLQDPSDYTGPLVYNPRIIGEVGSEPEIQVVIECEEGWIVIVENCRGDLGCSDSTAVGEVEGHAARHYNLAEVDLVQWSDEGRWYGVLGRLASMEMIMEVVSGMRLVKETDQE